MVVSGRGVTIDEYQMIFRGHGDYFGIFSLALFGKEDVQAIFDGIVEI